MPSEVVARTILHDVTMGDYSDVVNDAQITCAAIGKFCSIAAMTRINPGNPREALAAGRRADLLIVDDSAPLRPRLVAVISAGKLVHLPMRRGCMARLRRRARLSSRRKSIMLGQ